jgi:hypothetical protein
MPEVSWQMMMRDHPAAHLLVGIIRDGGSAKHRAALLARMARALRLLGTYAIVDLRELDGSHVHAVFELESDAIQVSRAVHATKGSSHPGWASQRAFPFDQAVADALDDVLRKRSAGRRTVKRRASAIL